MGGHCSFRSTPLLRMVEFPSSGDDEEHGSHITRIQQVACGSHHWAAVSRDGALFTWGWGAHGRLGHGDSSDIVSPKRLEAPEWCSSSGTSSSQRVLSVACGAYHMIAASEAIPVQTDGALSEAAGSKPGSRLCLWGWGGGREGQLGDGTCKSSRVPTRAIFRTPRGILEKMDDIGWSGIPVGTGGLGLELTCGDTHSLMRLRLRGDSPSTVAGDDHYWGWGENLAGQLGLGYTSQRVAIPTLLD